MQQVEAQLLTPAEAGRLLDLTPAGVRYLERAGKLRAMRTPTGRRLFRRRDVEQLAAVRRRDREQWG